MNNAVVAVTVSQAKAPPKMIIPARYSSVQPDIFCNGNLFSRFYSVQKRD